MNEVEKNMLKLIKMCETHEKDASSSIHVLKDLDRLTRMVESLSALRSPSCDFSNSLDKVNDNVHYLALFVDSDCLNNALDGVDREDGSFDKKPIAAPHVTLAYKPNSADVPRELFGKQFTIVIDGYGYDEENEAVRVSLMPDVGFSDYDKEATEVVQKLLDSREIPHITLSVSDNGKAVNSKNLHFYDIPPVKLGCVLGGHIKESYNHKGFERNKVSNDIKEEFDESKRIMFEYNALLSKYGAMPEQNVEPNSDIVPGFD